MQEGSIPIIITKKGKQTTEFILKLLNNQQQKVKKHRRQKTSEKKEILPSQTQKPSHQTLDSAHLGESLTRARRISSSGTNRKFPKDFFKDENSLIPTKIYKSKSKCAETIFLETFNQQKLPIYDHANHQKSKITDLQKISNTDLIKHSEEEQQKIQTPKFNNKHSDKISIKEYLSQKRIENSHKANDIEASQYISNKKHVKIDIKIKKPEPCKDIGHINRDFTPPLISNFNVTLGKQSSICNLMKKHKEKALHQKSETTHKQRSIDERNRSQKQNLNDIRQLLKASRGHLLRKIQNKNDGVFRIRKYGIN